VAKYLFIIPPVLVVWDFLHGALFGWALFGAFVAAETLRFALPLLRRQAAPEDTRAIIWLWAAMLVSLAASLISPWGIRSYELFRMVFAKSQVYNLTSEFLPTPFGVNMFLPFWAIMCVTALAMLAGFRQVRLSHVFVLVPLAYAAVRFNRATALFPVVCVPVLAYYLVRLRHVFPALIPNRAGMAATALLAAGLMIFTVQAKFLLPGYPLKLDTGLHEQSYPVGPAAFIKDVPLSGNMFNMGNTGGYLAYQLYPEHKIFLYNFPILFDEVFSKINDRGILDEYDISFAVSGNDYMLGLMFKGEQWIPLYWDKNHVLLVRDTPANRPVIGQYGLDLYKPGVKKGELKQYESTPYMLPELSREVARMLRFKGDNDRAAYLSNLLLRPDNPIGPPEAIALIDTAISTTPKSAALFYAKGMTLYLKLRDPAGARAALERATELSPRMEPAHINLGFALIDLGEHAEAAAHFGKAVSINAENPKAHYGLALASDLIKDYPAAARHWEQFLILDPDSRFASRAKARLKAARENMGR
jgi:tetratricopeptide (TPR) repeat protein